MILELPQPHINQQGILESSSRFRVVLCGRRFGKSELSQVEIITNALVGRSVAYITPTYALAKTFFDKLAKAVPFQSNRSDLTIQFPNDGSVQFFTGERLDNLRGRKFHFVVVDEASFIPNLEDGWLNSIRPTLTDYKGRALFLSTPKGKNYFYSLYMKGLAGEQDWASFKYTTYDNPYIDKFEIDAARNELPIAVFEQEYMANPSENAANPFGSAFIKQCTFPLSVNPIVCYGIDLAKSVDYTVIIGLDRNGSVAHFDRFQKDWRQTKQTIINLTKAPILMDSTGVGDPIFEDLQREGLDVTGFKFSQTSKQNLMVGLASAIQQRRVTFPQGVLTEELEIFEYQYTATGVKYCVSLDTMILTSDLKWQSSKDIVIGQDIIGFDEFSPGDGKKREFKKSKVISHEIIQKPCYKIILENDDILISSDDHKWLIETGNKSKDGYGSLQWITTNKLRGENKTNSKRFAPHRIVKPFDIHTQSNTYESGYLSGIFDGEGSLQCGERTDHYGYNLRLSFAQRDNEALKFAVEALQKLGIKHKVYNTNAGTNKDVNTVYVVGKRKEVIKALSIIRPKRLMNKFSPDKLGYFDKGEAVKIKSIEFIGIQDVVAMSTSTKTFIANGYASHNCAPSGFHDDCVMALALAWQHLQQHSGNGRYSFA